MSSVEFRIEVYHHDSHDENDWSYGCPFLGLMGYTDIRELLDDCIKVNKRRLAGEDLI